jgi:hypothetical protein
MRAPACLARQPAASYAPPHRCLPTTLTDLSGHLQGLLLPTTEVLSQDACHRRYTLACLCLLWLLPSPLDLLNHQVQVVDQLWALLLWD